MQIRWLGTHPSEKACAVIGKSLQCEARQCTEHVFVGSMVPAPPCAALTVEQLIAAWQVFDPQNKGELPMEQVLAMLTGFGESLSTQEANTALQCSTFDGAQPGTIDYVKFSHFIMSRQVVGW